eukprot:CAMPEP_0204497808 /NCGR_PEP_ID=MMETSP0471-20130131/91636_1 /ASSEMBLY_ACC=CAM_ASM_000602 /TAXON_ID=2969 /ORGANISM="Oxyrrhis marina" /LENGTH=36 /DNA_ID= /DNA_START= /DNA_END= /DNA_ORIENTATION=
MAHNDGALSSAAQRPHRDLRDACSVSRSHHRLTRMS